MLASGIEAAKRRAKIDLHVAAHGPAQVLEPLDECCVSFLSIPFDSAAREHNNTPCPLALLRASNERPRHSSAETRNEFPSPHVRPRFREGIVAILKVATEGLKPTPLRCAMSQMGQECRIGAVRNISALGPRADVGADVVERPLCAIAAVSRCSNKCAEVSA